MHELGKQYKQTDDTGVTPANCDSHLSVKQPMAVEYREASGPMTVGLECKKKKPTKNIAADIGGWPFAQEFAQGE